MVTRDKPRKRIAPELRQLAFSGWLPAPDEIVLTSDDWFTPAELVDDIEDWFGGTIDFDPCWSPNSFVWPLYAAVESEAAFELAGSKRPDTTCVIDALSLHGERSLWFTSRNRFCNPPYSKPAKWVRKLAEVHRSGDDVGDSLLLVRVDTSTRWWREIWNTADAICWFFGRIPFSRAGAAVRDAAFDHHALVYWGPHGESFAQRYEHIGHIERMFPPWRQLHVFAESRALQSPGHTLLAIDGVPVRSPEADEARAAELKSDWADATESDPEAITVVDEPILEPLITCPHCDDVWTAEAAERGLVHHCTGVRRRIPNERDGGPK